jgi:transposase
MVAGIDISKDTLDVHVSTGKSAAFSNSGKGFAQLKKCLAGARRVLMEATGTYHLALAEYLHQAGFEVVVINPARSHHYAKAQLRRNKTDKVDAKLLCEMALDDSHRIWTPPSPERKNLSGLLRARDDLTGRMSAKKAQLKNPEITEREREIYRLEMDLLLKLEKEIDQDLKEMVKNSDELREQVALLQTLPGIGMLTALVMIAGLPRDLQSAKQAAAFAGLTPKQVQSGLMKGKTSISKMGCRRLRVALYMSALSACRAPGILQDCYVRALSKSGSKKSALIVLAHKLIRIVFGVLKHQIPFQNKGLQTTG